MKRVYTYSELWEINKNNDCVVVEYPQNSPRLISIRKKGNRVLANRARLNYKLPLYTMVLIIPKLEEGAGQQATSGNAPLNEDCEFNHSSDLE